MENCRLVGRVFCLKQGGIDTLGTVWPKNRKYGDLRWQL